jgi:hypothetical protein
VAYSLSQAFKILLSHVERRCGESGRNDGPPSVKKTLLGQFFGDAARVRYSLSNTPSDVFGTLLFVDTGPFEEYKSLTAKVASRPHNMAETFAMINSDQFFHRRLQP